MTFCARALCDECGHYEHDVAFDGDRYLCFSCRWRLLFQAAAEAFGPGQPDVGRPTEEESKPSPLTAKRTP